MLKIKHNNEFIQETDISKLDNFKKFYVDLNVFGKIERRKFVDVPLIDKKTSVYTNWFVDLITGTMYNKRTLKCNSSQIYIDKIYKNV